MRERVLQAKSGLIPRVSVLAHMAALAAYRDCADWHAALLEYLRSNRDRLEQAVEELPGISMAHVEGTYLGWIDVRALGLDDPGAFFEAAGLGFSDGVAFGGPGFVRFNFGCPRTILEEAIARMRRAIETAHS